ncbi:synaptotagmin-like protein 2 [Limanda limanda]|uniref:synaptotagmin-like protein 2 n=1 Tax=Limanda limanda TaxID=27771 RepID=UPI0029C7B6A9|nr:synaptotagmin-like protein 2 [Limanda limanda]
MIDLSYLTEEEQETILAVLKRDAELKKADEYRVLELQRSVSDTGQLRYLTGEWFYETKQLRHQDRIHGSDIIRASMRHTHKPLTILELSQILPEQSSFVSSENKEVFVPPVLCGLLQEPHSQLSSGRQDMSLFIQDASVPMPMPENTALSTISQDTGHFAEVDGPVGRQPNSSALRGILKHLYPSSSADSLLSPLDMPNSDSPPEIWIDRKQVRFSSMVSQSGVEWQNGKEMGEHSLLDMDSINPSETENNLVNNSYPEKTGCTTSGLHRPMLNQCGVDSQEAEASFRNEANLQEQEAGQKQVLGGVFEHCHPELLGPAVPSFVSAEQVQGNQSDNSSVGSRPRSNSWIVQNKDRNSCQDTTTRACSLSRASSGSYDESPIRSALKRLSSRMSSSKSLENLTSQPREEMTKHESRQQSVDDVSSLPPPASTLSNSKQKKTSVSVPVLQQDETDSDSTFETNLGWRRNTGSSTSNISLSSGMASMSSVSGSTSSSIFPGDLSDIEVQGNIQFAVNYIQKLGEFHIFVVHCRELAVADTKKSRSDPYVKCYLLPDKTKLGKRKTTVKKKTFNPNYNEILRFKIIIEVLKTQNLYVSVWHNDTFGRNSFLGEVDLDLSEWDFSNTQINEYTLKSRVMSAHSSNHPSPSHLIESSGQMRVALRFLPQTSHSKRTSRMETGEVQIWVKDCKNLPSVRGVIIDPFVKCTVLPDTSRKSRQKTRVVKRTVNPMFNHTMVYDGFRTEDLREACVEITVWDHDRLSSHYIGGLRLGLGTGKSYGLEVVWMDSIAAEADLWQRMLESDGEWVEDVLPLRMFVLAKSMSK